jgi:hypothetical protein
MHVVKIAAALALSGLLCSFQSFGESRLSVELYTSPKERLIKTDQSVVFSSPGSNLVLGCGEPIGDILPLRSKIAVYVKTNTDINPGEQIALKGVGAFSNVGEFMQINEDEAAVNYAHFDVPFNDPVNILFRPGARFETQTTTGAAEVRQLCNRSMLKDFYDACRTRLTASAAVQQSSTEPAEQTVASLPPEIPPETVPPVTPPTPPLPPIEAEPTPRTEEPKKKGNNGWGNGDQDAPGNSLWNNNAENAMGNSGSSTRSRGNSSSSSATGASSSNSSSSASSSSSSSRNNTGSKGNSGKSKNASKGKKKK